MWENLAARGVLCAFLWCLPRPAPHHLCPIDTCHLLSILNACVADDASLEPRKLFIVEPIFCVDNSTPIGRTEFFVVYFDCFLIGRLKVYWARTATVPGSLTEIGRTVNSCRTDSFFLKKNVRTDRRSEGRRGMSSVSLSSWRVTTPSLNRC